MSVIAKQIIANNTNLYYNSNNISIMAPSPTNHAAGEKKGKGAAVLLHAPVHRLKCVYRRAPVDGLLAGAPLEG
jgi:hypothetical protein